MAEPTAAPMPIELGGVSYRMSPLRDADYVEFENWVRAEILDRAIDALNKPGLTDRQAEIVMKTAHSTAATATMETPEGKVASNSISGLARLLWIGIRPNHPGVKLETIRQSLFDDAGQLNAETIQMAQTFFQQLNTAEDGEAPQEDDDESEKPKAGNSHAGKSTDT